MTLFISGGCKNGKSSIAEDIARRLAGNGPLYYLATMKAYDDEDRARIKRHVAERDGKGFTTVEQPMNILDIRDRINVQAGTFLLDSVTALMINELYRETGAMGDEDTAMTLDKEAPKRVAGELTELAGTAKNIVFVSDYIYLEKDHYSTYTLDYLEALSYVDRALAKISDCVLEVSYANLEVYKGELPC